MTNNPPADRALVAAVQANLQPGLPSLGSGPLVVGVSGGPDSVCLLHVLHSLAPDLGLRLVVAHFNHGLRGAEAEQDALLVQETCQRLHLPIVVGTGDINVYRQEHPRVSSIEAAARALRYSFFLDVAEAQGASGLALGHTADDQVETVLLHLIRGAGPTGAAGMTPVARWQERESGRAITLLRPLLTVAKADTLAYCRRHQLSYAFDSTNASPAFTRNRLRHEVLPLLRVINPTVDASLLRFSGLLREEEAYWEAQIQDVRPSAIVDTPAGLALERRALQKLPLPLVRRLIRLVYLETTGTLEGLEASHVDAVLRLLQSGSGKQAQLPDQVVVTASRSRLLFGRAAGETPEPPEPALLELPGEAHWNGWALRSELQPPTITTTDSQVWEARLDARAVCGPLTVRSWQPGDHFQPLGMSRSKKLQDFFVDAHVPRTLRSQLPVIASDDRILWVAGQRIAEPAKVTADTQTLVILRAIPPQAVLNVLRSLKTGSYNEHETVD